MIKGTQLHPDDRKHVLAAYVHRFTREHVPMWSRKTMPNGNAYPVQFESDSEWLANTLFAVRKDGRLDRRVDYCESSPTWPNGKVSNVTPSIDQQWAEWDDSH